MPEKRAGRAWLPPALLLAFAASGWLLYNHSPPQLANRVIYAYAASLIAGPSLVYPWMRRRGASPGAAVAGALLVPFAWLVKEGHRITAVFSFGEAVYYAFNPLSLGLHTAAALQMAVWELLLRRPWRAGWRRARGPALALGAVLLFAVAMQLAGRESGGSEIFYSYVALHGRLFGE